MKTDTIAALRAEGRSWDYIAAQSGLHKEAARARYRRWRKENPAPEDGQQYTFTSVGNAATIVGKGRITTLEQLLDVCQVDMDIWRVDRYEINKWEVGAKEKHSSLQYASGSATGWIEQKGLKIEPLFQVKAWLVRKAPISLAWPTIAPVQIKTTIPKPSAKRESGLRKALIIPDSQNGYQRDLKTGKLEPFHDRLAWDVCVQVAQDIQPDRIILLGDMLDLPEWTDRFMITPEHYWVTQPALVELHWWLARLRLATPDAEIVYMEGNHEHRLPQTIAKNAIAAYELRSVKNLDGPPVLSVPYLLALDNLHIQYLNDYPNDSVWINDNLCCEHGDIARSGSGDSVKAILSDVRCSKIVGHIHRIESACKTTHSRRGAISYKVISPGTIARIDGVVPAKKKRQNWQQGFAVVEHELGNGLFHDDTVNIYGGRAVYGGRLYVGVDRTERIARETGWEALNI